MDWEAIPVLSDFVRVIVEYSPRAVFAVIALGLGWLIGRVVSFLINRVVGKLGLETAFRKISIGRAILRAGYTPSSFFGALSKGVIYLFAIFSALKLLSIPILTESIQALINYLPNLIGGVLIMVAGFTCVDGIGESIEKGVSSTLQPSLLSGLVRMLLYFVTITIALSHMKIDVTILFIFTQAFAWSLAIAMGIALGWNLKDRASLWLGKILPDKENDKETT
ncbi:MAG: hypothetical protein QXI32_01280 [Candidatus Bathyarchaeia archaeon]